MRGRGKGELEGRERARCDSHYSRASEEERQTSGPSLGRKRRLKRGITRAKGERKEREGAIVVGRAQRDSEREPRSTNLDSSGANTETGDVMPIPISSPLLQAPMTVSAVSSFASKCACPRRLMI